MNPVITGPATVLGDNIDTDQIVPGRYLELVDPQEIGAHCLEGADPEIPKTFRRGGIVVAGKNFGCGSSREHAPIALLSMGAAAVAADSFARIFYRNAVNLGLPLVVCKGLSRAVRQGEEITIDLAAGAARLSDGRTLPCEAIGDHAMEILRAGGIKPLMRGRLGAKE